MGQSIDNKIRVDRAFTCSAARSTCMSQRLSSSRRHRAVWFVISGQKPQKSAFIKENHRPAQIQQKRYRAHNARDEVKEKKIQQCLGQ